MAERMETEVECLTRELREALESRREWVRRSMAHEAEEIRLRAEVKYLRGDAERMREAAAQKVADLLDGCCCLSPTNGAAAIRARQTEGKE